MEVVEAMPQPQAPWARTATAGGLGLRIVCALATLATTASTGGFSSHPALCFLAAASTLQCVWTMPLALLNLHTLLSGQWPLENHHWIAGVAAIAGDGASKCKSIVHRRPK
ncbi:CASP-like protein 5A2 [Panicum virgatum]|uniref:CASP-like protein 5A2 n=1 Tax=Panicum virgatum TaxID=38727 RepID=UPI0019D6A4B7|nr:CASP-like protein 5A2 [Panicum virgatum]